MYEKPVVVPMNDMAEGVYMASGGGSVQVGTKRDVQDWSGSGQATWDLTLPSVLAGKHISLTVQFSAPVTNAWCGGNVTSNGNGTVVFDYWNAPATVSVTAQATDIGSLQVTGASAAEA